MSNTRFTVLKKLHIENVDELGDQQIMDIFFLSVVMVYMDFEYIFLAIRTHK